MKHNNKVKCILFSILISGCVYKEIPTGPDCSGSDLSASLVSKTDATTCTSTDGLLEVTGVAGTAPYLYALNGGTFQSNPTFTSLGAGTYTVTAKDAIGCTFELEVVIGAANSTLAAASVSSEDTACNGPHNGSIIVAPSGGAPPYELKLDAGSFGAETTFTELEAGMHTVVVRDTENCTITLNIKVDQGTTGVSFAAQVAPILHASCNLTSCHGPGTGSRDWTVFTNVKANAINIKTRTANGSMPPIGSPDITPQQIKLIACWANDGAPNN